MTWKIVTLPFIDPSIPPDTEALETACAGHDVRALAPVIHERDGTPHLTVVICCAASTRPRRMEAWRDKVAERDREVFDQLHTWRREQARVLDLPPYYVLTNRVMATLAAVQPRTRDELLAVPGVGPVTVQRHGEELLEVLRA